MRRFTKYPITAASDVSTDVSNFKKAYRELQSLCKYDTKGHGSIDVVDWVDDDGYVRAGIQVTGSCITTDEARKFINELEGVIDDVDAFNKKFNVLDDDM